MAKQRKSKSELDEEIRTASKEITEQLDKEPDDDDLENEVELDEDEDEDE
jgi:hypothetical protein